MSKVYIGKEVLDAGRNLRVICTASTGTNHIDKAYAAERGLPILALTEERHVISRISSTAELAFALTLAGLRHVVRGHNAVLQGEWDYTRYIGRQMNCLTVGVIGYGRLGSLYAGYCKAFGSRVIVYDPYKTVDQDGLEQVADLEPLLAAADVVVEMPVVKDSITREELRALAHEQYGDIIKAVVDVEQGIIGVGGELHVDIQSLLIEKEHSHGDKTWGINLYLDKIGDEFIEFDSMVNLKPASGNRTRGVEDIEIRASIRDIVDRLVT